MTALNDGESRRKEVEISMVETMSELLAVTSIDPTLSEESRTAFALAAALFRVRAVELQGADTLACVSACNFDPVGGVIGIQN